MVYEVGSFAIIKIIGEVNFMYDFICLPCGFIYESKNDSGFEELPLTWTCPDCGASKQDFEPRGAVEQKKCKNFLGLTILQTMLVIFFIGLGLSVIKF